jgi:NAD(P)-dependent dehydrogenase (short-subunit alcohol dehydrogenase family)
MKNQAALKPGRVAVITGGASGIGLAAAALRRHGVEGVPRRSSERAVEGAAEQVAPVSPEGRSAVLTVPTNVSKAGSAAGSGINGGGGGLGGSVIPQGHSNG